jgi:hypothetical protein
MHSLWVSLFTRSSNDSHFPGRRTGHGCGITPFESPSSGTPRATQYERVKGVSLFFFGKHVETRKKEDSGVRSLYDGNHALLSFGNSADVSRPDRPRSSSWIVFVSCLSKASHTKSMQSGRLRLEMLKPATTLEHPMY